MKPIPSHTRRTLLKAGLGGTALLAAGCGRFLPGSPGGAGLRQFHGTTMGTTYTVKFVDPHAGESLLRAARESVRTVLDGVVGRMSVHDAASELSRFNRHRSMAPFELSAPTLQVLAIADEVSAASASAFDVTVAPAVAAWGFGPAGDPRIPPAEEIAAARAAIGHRGLTVDLARNTASKAWPGIAADLSGVAKGFGVDECARALEALGIERYMVEVGGEVRTRGRNAEDRAWQIGIERPDVRRRAVHFVVPLSGASMATSGDYRIFFEQAGRRYSHEIDPRNAWPVFHDLASVTVVAADCARADAWSTALYVLGPERGLALAERAGIAAYFITRAGAGAYVSRPTTAFAALGGRVAAPA